MLFVFNFERDEAEGFECRDKNGADDSRKHRDASTVYHSDNCKETDSANETAYCLYSNNNVSEGLGVNLAEQGREKIQNALLAGFGNICPSYSVGISLYKSLCICTCVICVHKNLLSDFGTKPVKSSIFDILYLEKSLIFSEIGFL